MEKYPHKTPQNTVILRIRAFFNVNEQICHKTQKPPVKHITRRYKHMLFYTGILYHIVLKTGIIILYVITLCVIIIYVMKQPI